MNIKQILKNCNCCITGKPLKDCKNLNMVELNFRAQWEAPVWGNFLTGHRHMAIAYVHDDCIDDITGNIIGKPTKAIEFGQNNTIVYHDIPPEQTCRKCGCTDSDCSECIKKTGQPCHWVEPDLCSACIVLSIYTIYKPNEKEPDNYTIAKWDIIQGATTFDKEYTFLHHNIEACRKELRSKGLINQGGNPMDDKLVVESWI